ncbi:MAG: hypothetical protein Tp1124DCM108671_14 [Prokaryotic dsDNA virus sp.]|nr:MAG: hypothetical protein Tp1125DCM102451_34 [Prokaryotic dsDNA virus sp.]QDP65571.1 MAG: hypothetical protein Tp1124DCM108671_14 [Prokaryotic dsDNA virus sp.]|tara:strand:+ start:466 stop:1080 length:615 start_codon:yes stop_codon:yes gene_type:complete
MKLKINNKGEAKDYTINNWDDVTLDKWLHLIGGNEDKSVIEKALATVKAMSDMPIDLYKSLSLKDAAKVFKKMSEMQVTEVNELVKKIKVDKKEYGFIPNLDEITLGEYADIEQFMTLGVEKNLHNIMAVLYRPIVEQEGETYSIEAYGETDMKVRAEKFKKMNAQQVQEALVFFWTFVNSFLKTLQSSLTIPTQTKVQTKRWK